MAAIAGLGPAGRRCLAAGAVLVLGLGAGRAHAGNEDELLLGNDAAPSAWAIA